MTLCLLSDARMSTLFNTSANVFIVAVDQVLVPPGFSLSAH